MGGAHFFRVPGWLVGDKVEPCAIVGLTFYIHGGIRMRRWICAALLLGCISLSAGCILPMYSAIPERRAEQLVYTSENLRLLLQEWERFWMVDQPDHMTPYRVHGGVI